MMVDKAVVRVEAPAGTSLMGRDVTDASGKWVVGKSGGKSSAVDISIGVIAAGES